MPRCIPLRFELKALTWMVSRGMKVAWPARWSRRCWIHSLAVFSLSTTIASKWRPRTVLTASAYFFCLGLHRSLTRPLTPGKMRFSVDIISFIRISFSLCFLPSSASSSFFKTTWSFSSISVRIWDTRRRSEVTAFSSFFLRSIFEDVSLIVSAISILRVFRVLVSASKLCNCHCALSNLLFKPLTVSASVFFWRLRLSSFSCSAEERLLTSSFSLLYSWRSASLNWPPALLIDFAHSASHSACAFSTTFKSFSRRATFAVWVSRSFVMSEILEEYLWTLPDVISIFSSIGTSEFVASSISFSFLIMLRSAVDTSLPILACSFLASSRFFSYFSTPRRYSLSSSWCFWISALDSSINRWKWNSFHRMCVIMAWSRSSAFRA